MRRQTFVGVTVDEVRELTRIYSSIADPTLRRQVMDFVASLAEVAECRQLESAGPDWNGRPH